MIEITEFPCGCRVSVGDKDGMFLLEACRETCDTVRTALGLADDMDKPVKIMERDAITVTCLGCGKTLDAVTGITGNTLPDPGSVSICWYCACVAMYDTNPDGDLYLRFPTADEQCDLDAEPLIQEAVAMIKERK